MIIRACLKLNLPYQALEIAFDPVKYGVFPARTVTVELLRYFSWNSDLEGECSDICMCNHASAQAGGCHPDTLSQILNSYTYLYCSIQFSVVCSNIIILYELVACTYYIPFPCYEINNIHAKLT